MANITVSDLRSAGSDLFADSESFMQELTETETNYINGGAKGEICGCIGWSFLQLSGSGSI